MNIIRLEKNFQCNSRFIRIDIVDQLHFEFFHVEWHFLHRRVLHSITVVRPVNDQPIEAR